MAAEPSAYLVARRDDGFGEVHPLKPGARYTLGRAATNTIVLRDDMCSREHAEIFQTEGEWCLRDLGSLNGSRVNNQPVTSDYKLAVGDEVNLGRTNLLFVEDMTQLPDLPPGPDAPDSDSKIEIKKRLGQTRFHSAATPPPVAGERKPGERAAAERAVSSLYRLALQMGTAVTQPELVQIVLDGLLDGIPAEVGAVLALKEGRELEVLAYRHRDPAVKTYHKVSQFVSNEVLAGREAILAENIAHDRYLRNRESLTELRVVSLICAPILFEDQLLGLIHLYSTNFHGALDTDDLEFALAVARQIGTAMHQLRRQASLSAENRSLREQLGLDGEMVGASGPLREIMSQISRVAETKATVLVRGESGVGKELVARAIHQASRRKEGPFVCLNCAALTETLLESELFGHEKGSFTGATERMIGKFESADQGTIFLDEIGEMAQATQAKFLRVLEGQPFERVGGNTPIHVDVRVVAATNRGLEEAVRAGEFRKDLFYRLQVVEMRVPPLRERPADIRPLAEHFLKRFARETGRKIRGFTPAALEKLEHYDWPGNVRELRNAIERSVALGSAPMLDAADVWLASFESGGVEAPVARPEYEPLSLADLEKRHILDTLRHTDWNKSQAATILGIERSTLDRKIKGYDLRR
jgi:Nif-specific regulatory protein